MSNKSIQQIMDEQRKASPIFEKSDHSLAVIQSNQTRVKDPAFRARLVEHTKKLATNEDWQRSNAEANRLKALDPAWQEANALGAEKRKNNPNWVAKNALGVKGKQTQEQFEVTKKKIGLANQKPMQTPDGVFESMNAASAHYKITPATLSYRLRKYPDKYYYIKK